MRDLENLLAVARGSRPARLVLRNARLINVLSGEIHRSDIAIAGQQVAGLGERYEGDNEIDLEDRFVAPGLIDAHVHIESSLVPPHEFARAVVPRGVTTVITDPHEIANVRGIEGIRFMLRDAESVPLEVLVNASSCVPATHLATSGARLEAAQLAELRGESRVLGLAEVMNFPGVVAGERAVLDKLLAFADRPIDGHCPGLTGAELNAYVAAGISSDHECTTVDEAREKLRLGLTIFIREASTARNLTTLLPLIDPRNHRRICLCTDDRQPADLLDEGSIDHLVRTSVAAGLDPVDAIRLATLNASDHYRLADRGAIAPGRRADLIVFSDVERLEAEKVFIGGRLVAEDGQPLFEGRGAPAGLLRDSVRLDDLELDLAIPATGITVRVIGVVQDQLITESLDMPVRIRDGVAVADPERDLLKMVVIERHQGSGNIGKGFVRGIGLGRGAIAGTVAHDHHNLVAIGADDRSLLTAARAVAAAGGGLAAAVGDRLLGMLPLPLAGLMSDQSIEEVRRQFDGLLTVAHDLGARLHDPFMAMSFLGLEVIPSLKLTDRGLVDVERFELVPLFTDRSDDRGPER